MYSSDIRHLQYLILPLPKIRSHCAQKCQRLLVASDHPAWSSVQSADCTASVWLRNQSAFAAFQFEVFAQCASCLPCFGYCAKLPRLTVERILSCFSFVIWVREVNILLPDLSTWSLSRLECRSEVAFYLCALLTCSCVHESLYKSVSLGCTSLPLTYRKWECRDKVS